ncbi:hypothetical protein Ciccas_010909 [Cichlidogyrus casuarinus]|uniref:Rab proteins geranylgeranyltransferase component A n=1 Tax=Cichlidogyrus casuarinus TaxID=1844966 RepID=A0ABD2PUT4_9PLAT
MDFPNDMDVLVVGTSMVETLLASSLSVVGASVLLIDRNAHYGGMMSSLNYPDLPDFVKTPESNSATEQKFTFQPPETCHDITDFEEKWFTKLYSSDRANEMPTFPTNMDLMNSAISTFSQDNLGTGLNSNDTSHSELPLSTESEELLVLPEVDGLSLMNESSEESTASDSKTSISRLQAMQKSTVLQYMRRMEFDIMPKLLLCESVTLDATLRSDIGRYMTFRFVNNLLSYQPKSAQESTEGASSCVVEVPVCRKDIFTSKIISLRQKRTLGAFLEWGLKLNSSECSIYQTFQNQPLHLLLAQQFNQDEFTQKIVISHILMCPPDVLTETAVVKMRQLLQSMNKFGPFPYLIPMYGSADFPMAYARLAAVFAAVTCLSVNYSDISVNKDNNNRRYKIMLTNGATVYADFVLLGSDYIPRPLKQPYMDKWVLRAVFVVLGSLSTSSKHFSSQVSLLPFPNLIHSGLYTQFIPYLIHKSFENIQGNDHLMGVCQACAVANQRIDSVSGCFSEMVDALFVTGDGVGDYKKPRLLHAMYFQYPVFPDLPVDMLQQHVPGFEHVYVAPSPDASLTLDSCFVSSEKIFNDIFKKRFPQDSGAQDKDRNYASLHAIWDGKFPPKPPKPEQLSQEMEINELVISAPDAQDALAQEQQELA